MAFGEVGGAVTELVLTCRTPSTGDVHIEKGDALVLTGPYTVTNVFAAETPVFGQALAAVDSIDTTIPVKVRGICLFGFTGDAPAIDGHSGVVGSDVAGKVKAPASGNGTGLVLKVDTVQHLVHVML